MGTYDLDLSLCEGDLENNGEDDSVLSERECVMRENIIRKRLNAGEPTLSTRLWSGWSLFTEMTAQTGHFDYIELIAEYAPLTQADFENVAMAAELHGVGSMLKIDFQNRGYVAQKAVGAGFQAILFADHHTPEEIRETVYMMKPDVLGEGRFGYPNRRYIGGCTHLPQMEHAARVRDVVLAFMIEKAEAVEHIDEICSIPGVDMVQFGPSDYSMSMGKNREDYVAEYREAERKMIKAALAHGVQPRCEIQSADEAQYYLKMGVKHFSLGDQYKVMRRFLETEGAKLRNEMKRI